MRRSAQFLSIFLVLTLSACSNNDDGEQSTTSDGMAGMAGMAGMTGMGGETPEVPTLPEGCDALVSPSETDGDTVQTALIEVAENQTICFDAGTFSFKTELSLSVPGVTLKGAGMDETILDFGEQDVGGNGLLISSNGVTIQDLQVLNTPGDGIRANEVEDIHFKQVKVIWENDADVSNGAYGLYPVGCVGVRIEGCIVKGASDAGIYVGQSRSIIVKDSEAYGNVAGIEVENSTDAEVVNNYAHDNAGGILVFNLPELPIKNGSKTKIHKNRVENNNLTNFAKRGSIVSQVPSGTGIIILATDDNEITENTLKGNNSSAVIITSYIDGLFGLYEDEEFDAYPNGNYIHNNTYEGNGLDPQGIVAALELVPGPDILWDACVAEVEQPVNCIQEDASVTFLAVDYCNQLDGQFSDRTAYDCSYETLPGQDP